MCPQQIHARSRSFSQSQLREEEDLEEGKKPGTIPGSGSASGGFETEAAAVIWKTEKGEAKGTRAVTAPGGGGFRRKTPAEGGRGWKKNGAEERK